MRLARRLIKPLGFVLHVKLWRARQRMGLNGAWDPAVNARVEPICPEMQCQRFGKVIQVLTEVQPCPAPNPVEVVGCTHK